MKIETVEFGGRPANLRLTHADWEMIITLDVGPRILSFGLTDGPNMFKVFDEHIGLSGGDEWLSYGGHRLWHAPEVEPRTYYPDNAKVDYDWRGDRLLLSPPEEKSNRLQLQIEISLDEQERVRVLHRITNTHVWDIELAAWALSVMAPGGRAILPQEPFVAHGETYAPARPLVIWPFANMADSRYVWGEKFIQFKQDDTQPSKQKFGALNTPGWAAYALEGSLFIKRFDCEPGADYPDMGCNCEFFTMPGFLEVETLSPLTLLTPGAALEHIETWSLHRADPGEDDSSIETVLAPLV